MRAAIARCGTSDRLHRTGDPMAKHSLDSTKALTTLTMLVLVTAMLGTLGAQSPEPKPAFSGQTDAPAPAPSAPFQTQVVTDRLNSPWSIAFLPDGSFL